MRPAASPQALRFGPYLLDLRRRMLTVDGQEVRLGGRALELLAALAHRPGELLTRDELVRQVWPTTVVEETSLRVHIHALRKALGESSQHSRYIANVPGRGYSFIGAVEPVAGLALPQDDAGQDDAGPRPGAEGNLPFYANALLGRSGVLQAIGAHLAEIRLLTVVGAGGMGKTRVAVAAAHELQPRFGSGAWFVDLSAVTDPARLTQAVAVALGVFVQGDKPWPRLLARLRNQPLLLVLDNCEHLLEEAAIFAAGLITHTASVRIIATSRAPLGIAEERVLPLTPLDADSAVELFFARAQASQGTDAREADAAQRARSLCERLDCMPLAVELAAVRAGTLGLERLARGLDDLFEMLARGRRSASPRHRTLEAMLDWSHGLLSEPEQRVLARLSAFRGDFCADSAVQVAACARIGEAAVRDCLDSLVEKSLLTRKVSAAAQRLALLHITRAYAAEELAASADAPATFMRHAAHVCRQLDAGTQALHRVEEDGLEAWHAEHSRILDDARAAVEQAFSPGGDARSGVRVCAAARYHVIEFGLFAEFGPHLQRALELLPTLALDDDATELRLLSGWTLAGIVLGYKPPDAEAFVSRMLELVARVPDRDEKTDGLCALIAWSSNAGDHMRALEHLGVLRRIVPENDHPAWVLLGERMLATIHHFMGDHDTARALMQRVFDHPTRLVHRRYGLQTPRQVNAAMYLIRMHWIQGRSDEASALLEASLADRFAQHPIAASTLIALGGIPLTLWQGRHTRAEALLQRLKEQVARPELKFWGSYIAWYEHILAHRQSGGDRAGDELPPPAHQLAADLFGTFETHLIRPDTVARVDAGAVGWCAPEILRGSVENRLRKDASDPTAERDLERALSLARCQHALAWELRAACSLARYWMERRDQRRATQLLRSTLSRVRQGLDTRDLIHARDLLLKLERPAGEAAHA